MVYKNNLFLNPSSITRSQLITNIETRASGGFNFKNDPRTQSIKTRTKGAADLLPCLISLNRFKSDRNNFLS